MGKDGSQKGASEHSGFWIMIFTGALTVITGLQWWAFMQSESAFVSVDSVKFTRPLVVGLNPLPIQFNLRNSGKNTAIIDELSVAISHELKPKPDYFKAKRRAYPPIVAGASPKIIEGFETGWGEETNGAVLSGQMPLYFYGVVKYKDKFSFGFKSTTGFCFVYRPNNGLGEPSFDTCIQSAYTYTN